MATISINGAESFFVNEPAAFIRANLGTREPFFVTLTNGEQLYVNPAAVGVVRLGE
jgi:hypothetical protein